MSGVRDQKIDALKAVAILFVVIGHAIVYNALFSVPGPGRVALGAQWIDGAALWSVWLNVAYSFHMPLFAFLSSYVLFGREGAPLRLIGKRALGLLVPYAVWCVIWLGLTGPRTLSGAVSFLTQRLLYPQSPGAAWFLYALFGCFAVFAIVRAVGGRDWMLVLSAVLVGGLIVLPIPGGDILGVFDIAWLYPFFVMGYLFAKHARSLAAKRTPLMIAGALLWAALLPLIWPVLVPEANWWYPSLRAWLHARGLPGAVVLLYGVRYLCAAGALVALFYAYDHVKGRALTLQAWIGRRTLGMYVIQPFFLLAASAWTHDWVVLAVVAFVGSLGATWLLELTPLTRLVMLGQRSRPRVQSTS